MFAISYIHPTCTVASCIPIFTFIPGHSPPLKGISHPFPVLRGNTCLHMFVFLPGHFSSFSISKEFHTHFQSLGITTVFSPLSLSLKWISHPLPVLRDNTCVHMFVFPPGHFSSFLYIKWTSHPLPVLKDLRTCIRPLSLPIKEISPPLPVLRSDKYIPHVASWDQFAISPSWRHSLRLRSVPVRDTVSHPVTSSQSWSLTQFHSITVSHERRCSVIIISLHRERVQSHVTVISNRVRTNLSFTEWRTLVIVPLIRTYQHNIR